MAIPVVLAAALIGGGLWFYGKLNAKKQAAEAETVQEDVTSKPVTADHTKQISTILSANPTDNVNVIGLTDDELRSLFTSSPLTEAQINQITGVTFLPDQDFITTDQLRYVRVLHRDFNGDARVGELIVNEKIANDVENIFYELFQANYPIDKIRLASTYGGDDNRNMVDDNTNAFSFRLSDGYGIVEHEHSLGLAVDLNPLYNPQVIDLNGVPTAFPAESEPYKDRSSKQPHMIDHDDTAYQIFTKYGFDWGGDWEDRKDYQHFEKYDHVPISERYFVGNVLQKSEQASSDEETSQEQIDLQEDEYSNE